MNDEQAVDRPEADEPTEGEATNPDELETPDETEFSREYVEKLREESKGYRTRLREIETRADELAHRLHAAMVHQDGRLHNADDLPFHEDHLTDPDALAAGVAAVLADRPYLGRTATGDVGQGSRGNTTAPQNFSALFH